MHCLLLLPVSVIAAGDLWLLSADDQSTLLDAVMESFRIHDRAVGARLDRIMLTMLHPRNIKPCSKTICTSGLSAVFHIAKKQHSAPSYFHAAAQHTSHSSWS